MILYEHEYISDKNLVNAIKQNRELQKYFTSDFGGVKTTSFCGSLKIGGEEILILPKISKYENKNFNIFLNMILYSYNLSKLDILNQNFQDKNVYKIFIEIFAEQLLKKINQTGLYKEYISVTEHTSFIKGKLSVKDYILKRNIRSDKFLCSFDEFSPNHKLNQFFLYTIKTLKPFAENRKNLISLEKIFDEVDSKFSDNINFNHLNIRFQESYNLAKFLLSHLTNKRVNNVESFSFLFDMDKLYEDFVGKLFQEVWGAKLQHIIYRGHLRLEPDILLKNLIIDLKYKVFRKDSPKKEDKYQMYIYGNNFEIPNTMLLYPKHLKNFKINFNLGSNKHKVRLTAQSIDLNSDLEYKQYILEMKNRVRKIMEDYNYE